MILHINRGVQPGYKQATGLSPVCMSNCALSWNHLQVLLAYGGNYQLHSAPDVARMGGMPVNLKSGACIATYLPS